MRQRLNENPMLQLVVVGALLVVTGFMFATGALMPGASKSSSTSAESDAGPGATTAGQVATTPSPPAPVSPSTAGGAVATGPAAAATNLPPPPPLPRRVLAAYHDGKTIVLLVVRGGGVDDELVRGAVNGLRGEPRLAVFTTTAKRIARYAAITQGAGVDRVPALVVVRPRALDDGPAAATVTYGFQSKQSVKQAVTDAIYHGPTVGYSPN
jgi:hypothetical protein